MATTGAGVGTLALLVFYLTSGIFQPILVDVVRYLGGEGTSSHQMGLPMLFCCIGMLVAGLIDFRRWTTIEWSLLRRGGFWVLLTVDFLSGIFIYAGLSIIGSGTFILIYASCLPWTAVLSRCILKQQISSRKWTGVAIITLGLASTALEVRAICNFVSATLT